MKSCLASRELFVARATRRQQRIHSAYYSRICRIKARLVVLHFSIYVVFFNFGMKICAACAKQCSCQRTNNSTRRYRYMREGMFANEYRYIFIIKQPITSSIVKCLEARNVDILFFQKSCSKALEYKIKTNIFFTQSE